MRKPRTIKSTIKNDPWGTVIPMPEDPPEAPAAVPTNLAFDQPKGEDAPTPREQPTETTPFRSEQATQARIVDKRKRAEPAPEPEKLGKQKLTVHLDAALADRVKNAAYWNPRLTIAGIAELGIRQAIEKVEREHGGRYAQREGELIGGRPIK